VKNPGPGADQEEKWEEEGYRLTASASLRCLRLIVNPISLWNLGRLLLIGASQSLDQMPLGRTSAEIVDGYDLASAKESLRLR